jgi:TetR/AcrR family transcriptional regulator, mexJK operon transcriptional repressor
MSSYLTERFSKSMHFKSDTQLMPDQIKPVAVKMGRPTDPVKETAILQAARAAFLELPYERVSMDGVATRAGVSKVTIYAKYKSKEALFLAAMNETCEAIYNLAKTQTETGGPIDEVLTQLGSGFMLMILDPEVAALHGVMMQVAQHMPELPRQYYETVVTSSIDTLAQTLAIATERGAIKCPDPKRAAIQFIAMVQGVYRYELELGVAHTLNENEVRAYVGDCVNLFVRGYEV